MIRCSPTPPPSPPPCRIFTEPTIQLYSTILLAQTQTQGCLIYFTFTEITPGQLYIQKRRRSFWRKLKLKEVYITHGARLQKNQYTSCCSGLSRTVSTLCCHENSADAHSRKMPHLDTSSLIFISHLYGTKPTNFGTPSMHICRQGCGCLYILGLFRVY